MGSTGRHGGCTAATERLRLRRRAHPHSWDPQMSAVRTPAKHPRPTVVGRAPDELAGRDQPAGEAAPVAVRGTPDGAIESRLAVMPTVDLVARVRTGDRDALEVICLRC